MIRESNRNAILRLWRIILACVLVACLNLSAAEAQQPFRTDDAEVTGRGKFELEFTNEFDILQRSLFPNRRQITADFTLSYGVIERVEIGVESPLIALFNASGASPQTAFGIGDTSLEIKYNFRKERDKSWVPAMAVSFNVEFPTGSTGRHLGSGMTDYTLNMIFQKSLPANTTLRINAGVILVGDATTGVVGARNEGSAFTFGSSIVRQFTNRLDFGLEVTGVATGDPDISNQLQVQLGGNYNLRKNFSIDFGLIAGRDPGSPRLGVQLGFTLDFD
jgi:hypothetical protein